VPEPTPSLNASPAPAAKPGAALVDPIPASDDVEEEAMLQFAEGFHDTAVRPGCSDRVEPSGEALSCTGLPDCGGSQRLGVALGTSFSTNRIEEVFKPVPANSGAELAACPETNTAGRAWAPTDAEMEAKEQAACVIEAKAEAGQDKVDLEPAAAVLRPSVQSSMQPEAQLAGPSPEVPVADGLPAPDGAIPLSQQVHDLQSGFAGTPTGPTADQCPQSEALSEFPWAEHDRASGIWRCRECARAGQRNPYAKGQLISGAHVLPRLRAHAATPVHRDSVEKNCGNVKGGGAASATPEGTTTSNIHRKRSRADHKDGSIDEQPHVLATVARAAAEAVRRAGELLALVGKDAVADEGAAMAPRKSARYAGG